VNKNCIKNSEKMDTTKFIEEYRERIEKKIEIWVSMKEHGLSDYEISSFAVIRNMHGHVMKIRTHSDKYLATSLRGDNKKSKTWKIHRLLAMTFIEKPEDKKVVTVDHKDRKILNNDLNNLRWATPSQQGYN